MFVPTQFEETRLDVLHELIKGHPFGILINHGQDGLDANHIPFDLEAVPGTNVRLHSHVARANSLWQQLSTGDEVLVVFRGSDAYISPNWYPSQHEFHKQVPTWNYQVVHAHGRVTIRDDMDYVRQVVTKLTATHEASMPVPWQVTDSPEEFVEKLLKAVVGIEIEITRLTGKFKLSQNKDERDLRGAADSLRLTGESTISQAMQFAADQKFR